MMDQKNANLKNEMEREIRGLKEKHQVVEGDYLAYQCIKIFSINIYYSI